ncbi:MAG: undecaprenyl/decaprenyl-phosphate alpha-N-acetylglucosaminyl 1-phosphate transferase [Cytophagales bacterium]|nr:undecaprenyl/decaprenyl-phosphate alpha-N-acetylglucosaminyl 1-phosphate transferase [Cytophagales bacterium]
MFAIPSIIQLAYRKRLFDEPNNRTVHIRRTPRLGGLAIFAGFMSALTIFGSFGTQNHRMQQIFAGCILLFFIGLKDDILPVSALKKFFVQMVSTALVVLWGDIRIDSFFGILGIQDLPIQLSYAITFVTIIGITNAINLIDGLDGLAGVLIVVILGVFGFYFMSFSSPYAVFCFCLIGAIIGFLKYNIYKASIFMGDIGSLVCGFSVAVLAIELIEMKREVNYMVPVVLATLIVPISDTLKVFGVRMLQGKSPFIPDKRHIHHRLMMLGLQPFAIVMILAIGTLSFVGLVIYFKTLPITWLLIGLIVSSLMLMGGVEFLIYLKERKALDEKE